jgi:hypothetical protein
MTERKLREIALEVVIASNFSILGDDQQLLIVGPTQASNYSFIPLDNKESV